MIYDRFRFSEKVFVLIYKSSSLNLTCIPGNRATNILHLIKGDCLLVYVYVYMYSLDHFAVNPGAMHRSFIQTAPTAPMYRMYNTFLSAIKLACLCWKVPLFILVFTIV